MRTDLLIGKVSPLCRPICGCDQSGRDIDAATPALIEKLNSAQVRLGITPQCEINGMLCGKEEL